MESFRKASPSILRTLSTRLTQHLSLRIHLVFHPDGQVKGKSFFTFSTLSVSCLPGAILRCGVRCAVSRLRCFVVPCCGSLIVFPMCHALASTGTTSSTNQRVPPNDIFSRPIGHFTTNRVLPMATRLILMVFNGTSFLF